MLGTQWKGCINMSENSCYLQTIDVVEHSGTFQEAVENCYVAYLRALTCKLSSKYMVAYHLIQGEPISAEFTVPLAMQGHWFLFLSLCFHSVFLGEVSEENLSQDKFLFVSLQNNVVHRVPLCKLFSNML